MSKKLIVSALYAGKVRQLEWRGKTVSTAICKESLEEPLRIKNRQIVGDEQADLSVHGGIDKAVYAYALESYDWWSVQRGITPEPGAFGENITVAGLDEANICIGQVYQVGSARLCVTEPRFPCFKLGMRFGDPAMVKAFYQSGRNGVYFSVLQDGEIRCDDRLILLQAPSVVFCIREFAYVERTGIIGDEVWQRIKEANLLSPKWEKKLEERIQRTLQR